MLPYLVAAIIVFGLPTLYVAVRYREYRKFLAGAFFVSSGMLTRPHTKITAIRGTYCHSPARSLEAVGPASAKASVWYVECEDGWHPCMNYCGNPLVMDGRVPVQDQTPD